MSRELLSPITHHQPLSPALPSGDTSQPQLPANSAPKLKSPPPPPMPSVLQHSFSTPQDPSEHPENHLTISGAEKFNKQTHKQKIRPTSCGQRHILKRTPKQPQNSNPPNPSSAFFSAMPKPQENYLGTFQQTPLKTPR